MGRSIGAMHDRASEGDAEGRVRRVGPVMCARPVWSVFALLHVCQVGPLVCVRWGQALLGYGVSAMGYVRREEHGVGEPSGPAFASTPFSGVILPRPSIPHAASVILYHIPPLPSCTTSGMPPALHRDSQDGAARRACAEPASQVRGGCLLSRAAGNGVAGGKLGRHPKSAADACFPDLPGMGCPGGT